MKELLMRLVSAIARLWLGFSGALGRVSTALLLGAVYFFVLTPLALLFRAFTGGARALKADPSARSYFRERSGVFTPADLSKPW